MLRIVFLLLCVTFVEGGAIKPIPDKVAVNTQKAALGKKLFFDPLLSKDNTVSCATCHVLEEGGDDGLKYSFGVGGAQGSRNAPTVLNAVFNFRQFWDGRAKDLKAQAKSPIVNPKEMGDRFKPIIEKLQHHPEYKKRFNSIYPDGITSENIADAIAEYEKTLITPNGAFDRYLKGDKTAISKEAKHGYALFKEKGCILCHNGVNVGGNLFNRFGVYHDANGTDFGRYNVTGREDDKYVFKVPSLRNVARTAPYMHDGRFKKLRDAVSFMTEYQLGRYMEPEEIDAIVAFLETLNGTLPLDRNVSP